MVRGGQNKREPNDPEAMALATVDEGGMPDVRMVLLKGVDQRGFVFYTNTESAKGAELKTHPKAAMVFHWKSLRRQVRVRGAVSPVSDEEADAYFATRAKDSQIGAWASRQSRTLEGRFRARKGEVARYAAKFALNSGAAAALIGRGFAVSSTARDRILARPSIPACTKGFFYARARARRSPWVTGHLFP